MKKAGAPPDPTIVETVASLAKSVHTIAPIIAQQNQTKEDDAAITANESKGSLSSILQREKNLVPWARKCNKYDVRLLKGQLGCDLHQAIKKAGQTQLDMLRKQKYPCPPPNWHAFGGRS